MSDSADRLPGTVRQPEPLSDTADRDPTSGLIDPDRLADVEQKQAAIAGLLESIGLDAILLQRPENIAWFTSGGDFCFDEPNRSAAALFLTADARVVVCSSLDSGRIFEREVPQLGFQLKERQWTEPKSMLLSDLCRGRAVGSDDNFPGTADVRERVHSLRLPLTALACERIRTLGRMVSHAVEATARHVAKGQSESQIAGQLSHRLLKHQITPMAIRVAADGITEHYRQWGHSERPVRQFCQLTATGRKHGVCVSVTRTVSFGKPPRELQNAYHRALLVQATGMFFSKAEWTIDDVWSRMVRIYEKFGHPDEWRKAAQAEILGHSASERPFIPNSQFQLTPRMAVHWHPSIGAAGLGDTILIGESGFELLTPTESWPVMATEVKGVKIARPGILVRDADGSGAMTKAETEAASNDSMLMQSVPKAPEQSAPTVTAESEPQSLPEENDDLDFALDSDILTTGFSDSDSIFDEPTGLGDSESIFDD